ncbi:hypothetical protein IGK74_002443 [Enterococcus sp. AZ150]|uniref:hypothetical protein n=1 Tax=Enterococcus sp. AZ150 TaxID=2774866 RepID=UPI003F27E8B1
MTDIYGNDKILAALDDSIKELESLKLLMVEGIIMPTDINLSKRTMADREVTMNVTIDIDYEIMEKK